MKPIQVSYAHACCVCKKNSQDGRGQAVCTPASDRPSIAELVPPRGRRPSVGASVAAIPSDTSGPSCSLDSDVLSHCLPVRRPLPHTHTISPLILFFTSRFSITIRCWRISMATAHFLLQLLAIWGILGTVSCQSEEDGTYHFSEQQQGRTVWIVDDTSVPWIGSFQYLGSFSNAQTVLLTVVDSSTGATLGECATSRANGSAPRWERFQWELSMDGLQCSSSNGNPTRTPFPHTDNPRTFSVRIQAGKGPACIRELLVQNENPVGCPPHLSRNSFSSSFFNCSCPYAEVADESELESSDHGSLETSPQFPLFKGIGVETTMTTSPWTLSPSPCATHQCHNNGTCLVTQEGTATCLCRNGFTGSQCELDLCSSVPCQNGGFCRSNGGMAFCECPAGFTGLLCESNIDERTTRCNPECSNGQCVELNGAASCECRQGFTGLNCNVLDVCLGDAACSMFGNAAKCVLDETMEKLSSPSLINGTYDCRCPHPEHGQYVDCMELHAPKSTTPGSAPASPTFPVLEISQLPVFETTALPTTREEVEEETMTSAETEATDLPKMVENNSNPSAGFTHPPIFPTASITIEAATTPRTTPRFVESLTSHSLHPVITNTDGSSTFIFPQTPQTTPSTSTTNFVMVPNPKFVSPQRPVSTEEPSMEKSEEEETTESEQTTHERVETFPTPGTMGGPVSIQTPETPTIKEITQPTTTEPEDYEEQDEEEVSTASPTITAPAITMTLPSTSTTEIVEDSNEAATQATLPFWMTSTVETDEPPTPQEPAVIPDSTSSEAPETNEELEPEPSSTTLATTVIDVQQKENNKQTSAAASWIIAIIALIVLGLLLLATSLFVLRYIRQSRKLHGKYNPAREEHALSAAYAMPMSHIAKEERLI
ncbi:unnamed protein product [Caenorhabditis auriculariae]|uniref:EGF-like domain-containing protein n=1 Tax=Caenorhabditis auriculariae TaxID=2777116 RepID=A0A8S1H0S4_9PELO|nr:unnamed protein product [Caenorhabditis auriculariae]